MRFFILLFFLSIFSVSTGHTQIVSSPTPGQITVSNPQTANDPNDRRMVDFTCTTDSTTSNPNFSDENCFQLTETVTNGQAIYGNGTNAKKTFLPLSITGNMQGAGQKNLFGLTQNCYGMSDCSIGQSMVTFASGPMAGDEGQGFNLVSMLFQQNVLSLATINSVPSQTTCNTTLTQSVTASNTAQTVTVASTTGCSVNDWVVLGQEAATATPNESPMQIVAVGVGSLTGVIVGNYSSGTTVTPSVVLNTSGVGHGAYGQDRVLVDLSGTSYTTGTVASIAGGAFTGSGTTWTTGMVGGNSTVVGCIELAADQYIGTPFNGGGANGPLNSWYQILPSGLTSTNIGVYTTSSAGDASYHGYGPGAGTYKILPCAKILRVLNNQLVLESNSFTWTANDNLEEVISPYPDVAGHYEQYAVYTAGGVRRSAFNLKNVGARTMGGGISLSTMMQTGGNVDAVGWGTGFSVDVANVGFSIAAAATGVAFSAAAATTTTLSQTPCYSFGGMNLPNPGTTYLPIGLCANGNTAKLFFNYGTSTPNILNLPTLPGTGITYGIPGDLKATPTLTYTAIAAQTCQEQTTTVTGATTAMIGAASPATTLGSVNLSWSAWVSATNTVSVRVCNPSSGSITPSAVTWNVAAIVP